MSFESDLVDTVQTRLGHAFGDPDLLVQAVTHKSFANEAPPADEVCHNERLEFLGDAVLGLVVSEMLMAAYPDLDEGGLSRMRAALVNERMLALTAGDLALGELLRLGKGEERSGGREKHSLLANLFEAILGAVFLDAGMPAARRLTERALGPHVQACIETLPGFDPKSRLQVLLQQKGEEPPGYHVVDQEGPDHRRHFTVKVLAGDRELGRGGGSSKKEAEQAAARAVLEGMARPDADDEKGSA